MARPQNITSSRVHRAREIAKRIQNDTVDFSINEKAVEDYLDSKYGSNRSRFAIINKKDQLRLFNAYFGRRAMEIDLEKKFVRVEIEISGYWTGQQVTRRWE